MCILCTSTDEIHRHDAPVERLPSGKGQGGDVGGYGSKAMSTHCKDCGGVLPGVTTNMAGARPCTCQRVVGRAGYNTAVAVACSRCGRVVDNISPGYSIVAGKVVCAPCLAPTDRETARARTLDVMTHPSPSYLLGRVTAAEDALRGALQRIEALEIMVLELRSRERLSNTP